MGVKHTNINKILIIQTAFVGDVILATGLPAKLKKFYPDCKITFLVRKGSEELLFDHSDVDELLIWDKKRSKYSNLWHIIIEIRKRNFDIVINVQRHFSTGLITILSRAQTKIGFKSNPLSKFFTIRVLHDFPSDSGIHEIARNNELIASLTDDVPFKPVLNITSETEQLVNRYKENSYITIAPASVWMTKQFPVDSWIKLIDQLNPDYIIFLIGAPDDEKICQEIVQNSQNKKIVLLAGKLSLIQTAALIKDASYSFVNDSAPLHMASAFNVPVCAIFCSTLPEFGFYPLSDNSVVIETDENLTCRPCGLHGKLNCPLGHFKCGFEISLPVIIKKVNTAQENTFR